MAGMARDRLPGLSQPYSQYKSKQSEYVETTLLNAAQSGDGKKLHSVLDNVNLNKVNVDLKQRDTESTPLLIAAQNGHQQIVSDLLSLGSDVTLRNAEGLTVLDVAPPRIQQLILDAVNRPGAGQPLLWQAAWQGNATVVKKLLSLNPKLNINGRNSEGLTPLLLVTRDLSLFDQIKQEVFAANYNPTEVVAELLHQNVDCMGVDDEGQTALHYTAQNCGTNARNIVSLLARKESLDVDLRDRQNYSALHFASETGDGPILLALLDNGADVNAQGNLGRTPLHITASKGDDQTAGLLLNHGANVVVVDDLGFTPMDVAKGNRVQILLKDAWTEHAQKSTHSLRIHSAPSITPAMKLEHNIEVQDVMGNYEEEPPTFTSKTSSKNYLKKIKVRSHSEEQRSPIPSKETPRRTRSSSTGPSSCHSHLDPLHDIISPQRCLKDPPRTSPVSVPDLKPRQKTMLRSTEALGRTVAKVSVLNIGLPDDKQHRRSSSGDLPSSLYRVQKFPSQRTNMDILEQPCSDILALQGRSFISAISLSSFETLPCITPEPSNKIDTLTETNEADHPEIVVTPPACDSPAHADDNENHQDDNSDVLNRTFNSKDKPVFWFPLVKDNNDPQDEPNDSKQSFFVDFCQLPSVKQQCSQCGASVQCKQAMHGTLCSECHHKSVETNCFWVAFDEKASKKVETTKTFDDRTFVGKERIVSAGTKTSVTANAVCVNNVGDLYKRKKLTKTVSNDSAIQERLQAEGSRNPTLKSGRSSDLNVNMLRQLREQREDVGLDGIERVTEGQQEHNRHSATRDSGQAEGSGDPTLKPGGSADQNVNMLRQLREQKEDGVSDEIERVTGEHRGPNRKVPEITPHEVVIVNPYPTPEPPKAPPVVNVTSNCQCDRLASFTKNAAGKRRGKGNKTGTSVNTKGAAVASKGRKAGRLLEDQEKEPRKKSGVGKRKKKGKAVVEEVKEVSVIQTNLRQSEERVAGDMPVMDSGMAAEACAQPPGNRPRSSSRENPTGLSPIQEASVSSSSDVAEARILEASAIELDDVFSEVKSTSGGDAPTDRGTTSERLEILSTTCEGVSTRDDIMGRERSEVSEVKSTADEVLPTDHEATSERLEIVSTPCEGVSTEDDIMGRERSEISEVKSTAAEVLPTDYEATSERLEIVSTTNEDTKGQEGIDEAMIPMDPPRSADNEVLTSDAELEDMIQEILSETHHSSENGTITRAHEVHHTTDSTQETPRNESTQNDEQRDSVLLDSLLKKHETPLHVHENADHTNDSTKISARSQSTQSGGVHDVSSSNITDENNASTTCKTNNEHATSRDTHAANINTNTDLVKTKTRRTCSDSTYQNVSSWLHGNRRHSSSDARDSSPALRDRTSDLRESSPNLRDRTLDTRATDSSYGSSSSTPRAMIVIAADVSSDYSTLSDDTWDKGPGMNRVSSQSSKPEVDSLGLTSPSPEVGLPDVSSTSSKPELSETDMTLSEPEVTSPETDMTSSKNEVKLLGNGSPSEVDSSAREAWSTSSGTISLTSGEEWWKPVGGFTEGVVHSRISKSSGSLRPESEVSSSEEEEIIWKKGNMLGKGAFGKVWCGLTNAGQMIAVKQVELMTSNMTVAEKQYDKLQEEVGLLKSLRHQNIVSYLGTCLDGGVVNIFMEFVPGGSIASILARFGPLDESVFQFYTKQIVMGVDYLHTNNVVHRDIKGGNIMLMPTGVIKLIDFGCAKRLYMHMSRSEKDLLRSMKGTPYWMAPEVIAETGHGLKSDIWSVGCTVFEMATGKPPWSHLPPMPAILAIAKGAEPPSLSEIISSNARDFVACTMKREPDVRLSAQQLLNHPFLKTCDQA